MKSKLAVWSWILSIIAFVFAFIMSYLSLIMFADKSLIGDSLPYIGFIILTGTGLIFGVIALRKISKDPKLMGRGDALLGAILNGILFLGSLLLFILLLVMELQFPTY